MLQKEIKKEPAKKQRPTKLPSKTAVEIKERLEARAAKSKAMEEARKKAAAEAKASDDVSKSETAKVAVKKPPPRRNVKAKIEERFKAASPKLSRLQKRTPPHKPKIVKKISPSKKVTQLPEGAEELRMSPLFQEKVLSPLLKRPSEQEELLRKEYIRDGLGTVTSELERSGHLEDEIVLVPEPLAILVSIEDHPGPPTIVSIDEDDYLTRKPPDELEQELILPPPTLQKEILPRVSYNPPIVKLLEMGRVTDMIDPSMENLFAQKLPEGKYIMAKDYSRLQAERMKETREDLKQQEKLRHSREKSAREKEERMRQLPQELKETLGITSHLSRRKKRNKTRLEKEDIQLKPEFKKIPPINSTTLWNQCNICSVCDQDTHEGQKTIEHPISEAPSRSLLFSRCCERPVQNSSDSSTDDLQTLPP